MPVTIDGTTGITSPAIDVTTPVTTTDGGTELSSFTTNGAMYATSTSALTTGTLPVASGGTGQTTYTNGQLLIGNTTGNTLTKATLTAGTGISITNGTGSITIANTSTGGMTLIATIPTTSGTSVNSGTVSLTSYKQVQIVLDSVSFSGGANFRLTDPNSTLITIGATPANISNGMSGIITIDLATGILAGIVSNVTSTTLPSVISGGGTTNFPVSGKTTFSTASTIFTFSNSSSINFDAGSILIYGVS